MRISLIVAMSETGLIGTGQGLPWHLPADLKRFKTLTWGKPIIMGRKTHELICRPLPGRLNIVVSRQPGYKAEGCEVVHSLDEALTLARRAARPNEPQEIMIIGGAQIYREALPLGERVYLTVVEGEFEGETYFPGELSAPEWETVQEEHIPADAKNPHGHRFCVLERRTKQAFSQT
jgi:dihydrofolate reductase